MTECTIAPETLTEDIFQLREIYGPLHPFITLSLYYPRDWKLDFNSLKVL